MKPVLDEKGLRLARETRAALRHRESDEDLKAAIEAYDEAITPVERQAAAGYLLQHSIVADNTYREALNLAALRAFAPHLLPESER